MTPRRPAPSLLAALSLAAAAFVVPGRAARADTLVLEDGRVVDGLVTKDGDVYRVVSRFGETTVPAKDVRSVTKSKTVEAQWRERLASLSPTDYAGRGALAAWLKEVGRPEAAEASAKALLEVDPENAAAHAVLGHVRHKGAWMTPDDAKRADGLVQHGDRWYTPEEWAVVDGEGRTRADDAEKAAQDRRVAVRVNDALRLVLSPDPDLRKEGLARLKALAAEAPPGSPRRAALESAGPQVLAYAEQADRMLHAVESAESATVLTECRIQLARLKRPIRNFTTSLASSLAGGGVTIQLPELEVIKVDTTVPIPAVVDK